MATDCNIFFWAYLKDVAMLTSTFGFVRGWFKENTYGIG